jgi:hypothetical protein
MIRQQSSRVIAIVLLCWGIVLLVSCSGDDNGDSEAVPPSLDIHAQIASPLPPGVSLPLYSADSPWNQPIPPDEPVDSNSEAMIDQLVRDVETGNPPTLSVREWSVAVYVADENTPRVDIELTASWSPFSAIKNVPIPVGALPDQEADGHISIIDLTSNYEYDFWQAKQRDDGSWQASWGNRIPLDSSGNYPYGMSARGSGFASLAGMIWPEEFEQGHIDHALVLSIPNAALGGPVWPATESDGRSRKNGAIPEGARLQLDPDLDLNQFDMTPYERIIAETLQHYGAFVGDISGSVELEVINPISYSEDPYPTGWFDTRYTLLTTIPWEHMRVLELPVQIANPDLRVEETTIFEPK